MQSFNIILFGEAGSGKSSVINLFAEKEVAKISPDMWGCTLKSKQYPIQLAERTFNLWDTIGLGEPKFSATDFLGAIENTYVLIRELTASGGPDLLLFCIRGHGGRINETVQCNYRLFFEVLCEKRIPIALVVTHLEQEKRMEDWWDRNKDYITQTCGLSFTGHACVTGLADHDKAVAGRVALRHLLLSHNEGRYLMPPSDWFLGFLARLPVIPYSGTTGDKLSQLEHVLRDRCMLSSDLARQLAEKLYAQQTQYGVSTHDISTFPQPTTILNQTCSCGEQSPQFSRMFCNILLFGEAGVGKSSVINLLARKKVIVTSPDVWGCTLESKQYSIQIAGRTFNIWETIGLGELMPSVMDYLGAIGKAHALVQQIRARGGLHLLLFCISGSRITPTVLCSYKFFFELLGEKQIPIALVVTHREGEARMEDWWDRNKHYIDNRCGHEFKEHACITGLADNEKAEEGRSVLESLLLRYGDQERYTREVPPISHWYLRFLELLFDIPPSEQVKDTRKQLARVLRDRFKMPRGFAQRLAMDLTLLKDYGS